MRKKADKILIFAAMQAVLEKPFNKKQLKLHGFSSGDIQEIFSKSKCLKDQNVLLGKNAWSQQELLRLYDDDGSIPKGYFGEARGI